jgi:hypothetical protein
MSNRKYLSPAYDIIIRFSPEKKLSEAIDRVAEITGRSPSRVYLWMRPEEKGGTGGLIPSRPHQKLAEYAQKKHMALPGFSSAAA